jgi:hypothetical protein
LPLARLRCKILCLFEPYDATVVCLSEIEDDSLGIRPSPPNERPDVLGQNSIYEASDACSDLLCTWQMLGDLCQLAASQRAPAFTQALQPQKAFRCTFPQSTRTKPLSERRPLAGYGYVGCSSSDNGEDSTDCLSPSHSAYLSRMICICHGGRCAPH